MNNYAQQLQVKHMPPILCSIQIQQTRTVETLQLCEGNNIQPECELLT